MAVLPKFMVYTSVFRLFFCTKKDSWSPVTFCPVTLFPVLRILQQQLWQTENRCMRIVYQEGLKIPSLLASSLSSNFNFQSLWGYIGCKGWRREAQIEKCIKMYPFFYLTAFKWFSMENSSFTNNHKYLLRVYSASLCGRLKSSKYSLLSGGMYFNYRAKTAEKDIYVSVHKHTHTKYSWDSKVEDITMNQRQDSKSIQEGCGRWADDGIYF